MTSSEGKDAPRSGETQEEFLNRTQRESQVAVMSTSGLVTIGGRIYIRADALELNAGSAPGSRVAIDKAWGR